MTYVLRIRLPRDRSFIYTRMDRRPRGFTLDVRVIRHRYYSPRRVEFMRLAGAL